MPLPSFSVTGNPSNIPERAGGELLTTRLSSITLLFTPNIHTEDLISYAGANYRIKPITATVDAAGVITVNGSLTANDAGLNITGLKYKVEVFTPNNQTRRGVFHFTAPAAGASVNLETVSRITEPGFVTFVPTSGGGGSATWPVAGTPAFVAAGSTAALARNAIGAVSAAEAAVYDPAFTGYDVILIAGQSNADDFGIGVDAIYQDGQDPRIKQYARSGIYADTVVNAINPLLSKVPQGSNRIGFAMTFAKDYADARMAAGRKVLINPCAVGGTGFSSTSLASPPSGYYTAEYGANGGSWDPAKGDGGVSLYQLAIDKTNAAIASKAGSKLVAILWLQGEGDSTLGASAYAAKLDALIDGFRANITGAATVPFIVGQMVPDWSSFNTNINAVHAATPTRKTRCAFALGASGASNPGEPYHYNAIGQRFMGHSMYNAFATI